MRTGTTDDLSIGIARMRDWLEGVFAPRRWLAAVAHEPGGRDPGQRARLVLEGVRRALTPARGPARALA